MLLHASLTLGTVVGRSSCYAMKYYQQSTYAKLIFLFVIKNELNIFNCAFVI